MHRSLCLSIIGSLTLGFMALQAPVAMAQDEPAKQGTPVVQKQASPGTGPANLTPGQATGPPIAPTTVLKEQVIVAEPKVIELGTFSTTESEEGTITLRNTGDGPVTIRSAKASCGCTTADFQRNTILGPGETTAVTIRMRGGPTARKLNKTVTFTIDGYPQLRVPIQGESISYVTMKPDKLGINENPEGKIVLESIDEQPFKISRTVPDVLGKLPEESKNRHELVVDWDKWWMNAENAKLTFYVEGHPRCNQYFTVVTLNREQRAEIQRRIRDKREKGVSKKEQQQRLQQPAAARPMDLATLVRQGRIQEVKSRLAGGQGNVDEKDTSGVTLLGIAAKNGNIEVMKVLIESGAEIDATDRVKRTPLMHGGTSKNPEVLELLLDNGAEVNARDLVIGGPLAWSSAFGNADCVEVLVNAGAELETRGAATGYTPLIWASGIGDENSIPILLEAGADIEARDTVDGGTPVMHAAQTSKGLVALKALVEAGADINARDQNGKTALLRAAENNGGTVEKIQFLMDNGAQLDVVTRSGRSALELARARTDARSNAVIAYLEAKMSQPASDE